ncbi:UL36 very large tegument protein [Streptomyces bikiniensis]|uniref:UL36 very large tegument protein n=1 Tax=Streptomyces bikiniensis TaxID=1896 RepID=A0ABW8CRA7_STRBI
MTVTQTPPEVAVFTRWLAGLTARLRPDAGWYGVFAARDPEGLRACLDGTELLPWDVVSSLLQDAGEAAGGPFAVRGRALYVAAAAAHDRGPGAAAALAERREFMERERRYAETRARELRERLRTAPGPGPEEAARLRHDLAWTRDDLARAVARIAELTARLAGAGEWGQAVTAPDAAPAPYPAAVAPAPDTSSASGSPTAPGSPAEPERAGRAAGTAKAGRRPRGARYAWLEEGDGAREAEPVPASVPVLPTEGAAPRGARFGGAAGPGESGGGAVGGSAGRPAETLGEDPAEAARAAANAVYALRRLRARGRSGEAHALLCEALGGPPARLPALADELHRAGLGADWSTLLWEAASLPPDRLAAVAGALADAGRTADCEQLLRQGVARPVEELAGACAALRAEEHHREAQALLTAFVRVRAPEDAARLAGADPRGLVPQLLDAARAVSASRERDLLHALRVAGLVGV